jgi:ABC-type polysaccharide/polyol phosphate export permease
VKADLRRRYRRSVLGVGWSLLNPLIMAGVLCLVYRQLLDLPFEQFGPFLLTNLAFWNFMSASILHGCTCFYLAEPYIRQEPAPLVIYPLRTVLGLGCHLLIALATVLALSCCLYGPPGLSSLAVLPAALAVMFVLALSLSVVAAFANVYFPDVQHVSEFVLQILFFLTPIIYPPSVVGDRGLAWLLDYNPLATLTQLLRQALLGPAALGAADVGLGQWLVLAGWTAAAAGAAALIVARCERQLVFEL